MEKEIKKMIIFDMDGTFIDTPTPDIGKAIWKEKTGKEWSLKGWWGRPETLDLTIFDCPIIEDTFQAYKEASKDPTILRVLMTGRHLGMTPQVEALLNKHGLTFDVLKLNDARRGESDTIVVKKRQIWELIPQYPGLEEIDMYEDRPEHVEAFTEFLSYLRFKFNVIKVGDRQ